MKYLTIEEKEKILKMYQGGKTVGAIAIDLHLSDRRVRRLLIENGITLQNPHKKTVATDTYIEDKQNRFPHHDGFKYVAICSIDQKEFDDYENKSGALVRHLKEVLPDLKVPSLFKRKKYFAENGKLWHEQWFDIVERPFEEKIKQCPYCSWSTCDVDNKSGAYGNHILDEHGITASEHLSKYPEDEIFFKKYVKKKNKKDLLSKEGNYIICPICNERFERLTLSHINMHGFSLESFKAKFPYTKMCSERTILQNRISQEKVNLTVSKKRFVSKPEKEIVGFLTSKGLNVSANRQILIGKELDILCEDKHIAIEYDGLKWHTEWFGKKSHSYHLEKTKLCNQKGYGLIHIFEDEYMNHKDIVLSKLCHTLGISEGERVYARKCTVREIYSSEAAEFLNKNHIQGFGSSTVYYGAFYDDKLVGVMAFKNGTIKNKGWELTRYATDITKICVGLGGKLFKHFVEEYKPQTVFSFADRRWTIDIYNNFYTKIGFKLNKIGYPDYRYYNEKVERFKRFHKMGFNKQILHKKYGFPLTMTEKEMARELGYDRIWDCGLVKYVWTPEQDAKEVVR